MINVARIVNSSVGMSKVASSLAHTKSIIEALDRDQSVMSKTASEAIRALAYRVSELEKTAKITEVVTDLYNRGAIDESEIKKHASSLSEESGESLGYATKVAQEISPMFQGEHGAGSRKKTMEECINSKVRS